MKIAIVGGAGQLGSALVRELGGDDVQVTGLTRRAVDVTSPDALDHLASLAPDVIINSSAWNDVDGAETQPDAAFAVNRDGVALLAKAARRCNALLVHFSTDFVFDGAAGEPYVEESIASPLNVYGRSKLAGEHAARQLDRHYVLRLSSVFGGRVGEGRGGWGTIDRIVDALIAGREIRAFADRTVSPSYTVDVARATRALLTRRAPFGVYHCVSSEWTTWQRLAEEAARLVQSSSCIVPVSADGAVTVATRPRFCALSNAKLTAAGFSMPTWKHALRRHVAVRSGRTPLGSPSLEQVVTLRQ